MTHSESDWSAAAAAAPVRREALCADPNVKLVAMCDAFMDRLQTSLSNLKRIKDISAKIDVPPDRCFDGFDGYKKLLECVDVVLLCTPPGFRPIHLEAAVEAGKHVFCEKPVAVDAPGVQSVIEATARLAKEKNLSLCSGYCYRYDQAKRETVKRIHAGEIGDVSAMHITYLTGPLWYRGRTTRTGATMEYQMRNWYYYSWLSGDFIVEQHCHNFDKANWVLKGADADGCDRRRRPASSHDPEVRQHLRPLRLHARVPRRGEAVQRLPADGRVHGDVNDHVIGTKGQAQLMKHTVTPAGGRAGNSTGERKDMYQVEHDELFAGIRAGQARSTTARRRRSARAWRSWPAKPHTRASGSRGSNSSPRTRISAPKEYAWGDQSRARRADAGNYKFA